MTTAIRVEKTFATTEKKDMTITDETGLELIAAGPHAFEEWWNNSRQLFFMGYRAGEQEINASSRHYRFAQVYIKGDGTLDIKGFIPNLMLDYLMVSWRDWHNIYACGESGVAFTSDGGETWQNKNGDLALVMDGIPYVKQIEAVIR